MVTGRPEFNMGICQMPVPGVAQSRESLPKPRWQRGVGASGQSSHRGSEAESHDPSTPTPNSTKTMPRLTNMAFPDMLTPAPVTRPVSRLLRVYRAGQDSAYLYPAIRPLLSQAHHHLQYDGKHQAAPLHDCSAINCGRRLLHRSQR